MWITVKKAAELLNCSISAVQKNCQRKKYACRCIDGMGRGGKQYEVLLESLPDIARMRYYSVTLETNEERPNGCSHKQWSEAEHKARIVVEYQTSGLSVDGFIEWYNENFSPEKPLNRQRLFTYQKKFKKGGVTALVDNRGGATGGVPISEEVWEYFYSIFMTQQKRSVAYCYDKTKKHFPDIPFPSVSSFERKVRKIDRYSLVYYREGEKALADLLPSMERDKSSINSNDIWFSDHHRMDVFVKSNNGKGKPFRPWLTVFFDARSNKVISFISRKESPNSYVIKKCLRIGIEAFGVPKEVYFDNGKDYRSKQFDNDFPYSIVKQLGINCIHATPYHGQAKTVERFFGIVADQFAKSFDTYCGADNKNRPEQMRISDEKIKKIAPTLDEFISYFQSWVEEYNNKPSGGAFMDGDSPNVVYARNLKHKVKVNQDALDMMFTTINIRTVHKNGVSVYKNHYYNDALIPYMQRKVIVRNSPENIDKVYIFDIENNYICAAPAKIVTSYRNTSEADYAVAKRSIKEVKKHIKKYAPKRNIGVHELIAVNQAEEMATNFEAEVPETELVNIQAEKAVSELKKGRENSVAERRKNSISVVMNKYYEDMKKHKEA